MSRELHSTAAYGRVYYLIRVCGPPRLKYKYRFDGIAAPRNRAIVHRSQKGNQAYCITGSDLNMASLPPDADLSRIPLSPPPTGRVSNFVNPPSLAHVTEGVGGFLIALETVLLVLRTYSNVKLVGKLRFEDCIARSAKVQTKTLAYMG